MTTTADLIQATRRHVYGTDKQQINALKADIGVDDTTLTLTYPNGPVNAGGTIAVGLEVMYVWAWNPAALQATVQRGWNGSPQAAHSAGDIVTPNPRFSDWEILSALNSDLQDLSSPVNGLYRIVTFSFEAVSAEEGYDFPITGFQSIADIRWEVPNTVTKEWRPITDYTVVQDLPVEAFPSGTALFLDGGLPTPQQTVQVRYRATLGQLAYLTDIVEDTTGLLPSAADLPPIGAAIRIMAGRPIQRAQISSQGDTRRAAEVSTSDVVQAPTALRQLRQSRLAAESARLVQTWPFQLRSRDLLGPRRPR